MTYTKAKIIIWEALEKHGWLVKRDLKTPWAEKDGHRLWFKPQAIWAGKSKTIDGAHSLFVDMKWLATKEPSEIVRYIESVVVRF